MHTCYACSRQIDVGDTVGRTETCPYCHADLHCCRNCSLYDEALYNECREHKADRVLDKEKANFCEFFSYIEGSARDGVTADAPKKGGNPLDVLFKKT